MKHYSLLAKISRDHGGMTRASFRRSKALARLGEDVEVLTFNVEPDFTAVIDHVRSAGELGSLTVRNMHTELCRSPSMFDPDAAERLGFTRICDPFRPTSDLTPLIGDFTSDSQDFAVTEWHDHAGVLRRIDLRNREGTLFFVDERKANTPHPRRLTVLDSKTGIPLFQGGSFALQTLWLDAVVGSDLSAITIDGVAPSEAFAGYMRPNVVKFLIQHTIHQVSGTDPVTGPLEARVANPLRQNRTFDGLVTLTEKQRAHLLSRIDPCTKTTAIPNVNPAPNDAQEGIPRDPNLCVVVSRIEESNKQLSHVLGALDIARRTNPNIHAEIYGGPNAGPVWDRLHADLEARGLGDSVKFYGHEEQATRHFWRAGFTALTSKFEGQSLALVEAMSRGAIPLSYDVNYGPSEIVRDGHTGYLVPPNDIQALADRMVLVSREGPAIYEMRERGIAASNTYSEATVAGAWSGLYADALQVLPLRERLRSAHAWATSITLRGGRDVLLNCVLQAPLSRASLKSSKVHLQAIDHHSLKYASIAPKSVRIRQGIIKAQFVVPPHSFHELGRRDVTAWLRLSINSLAWDVRVSWDEAWSAWPARSPSGQLNLR
ncbi:glycosyltransferase [Leucobacter sp. NPDC015123]|uniref:glycosyltransferase n=1 Tax=Leucobacter sp. NPDC015123 TaxID=3364129 RepID=UPI0036F460D3